MTNNRVAKERNAIEKLLSDERAALWIWLHEEALNAMATIAEVEDKFATGELLSQISARSKPPIPADLLALGEEPSNEPSWPGSKL